MDRQKEQQISLGKEQIKEMIKDLKPGTILIIEVPVEISKGEENT
jgi:hypothetical protein